MAARPWLIGEVRQLTSPARPRRSLPIQCHRHGHVRDAQGRVLQVDEDGRAARPCRLDIRRTVWLNRRRQCLSWVLDFRAPANPPAINLLRTRLQAAGSSGHPHMYNGFMDVLQQTLRNEGWRGLYKGLLPSILKVGPAVGVSWIVYEDAKRRLGVS